MIMIGMTRIMVHINDNDDDDDTQAELRKAQQVASELRKDAMLKKMASDRKAKLVFGAQKSILLYNML